MARHGSSADEVVIMRHVAIVDGDAAEFDEDAIEGSHPSEGLMPLAPTPSGPEPAWMTPGGDTDFRDAARKVHEWMVTVHMADNVGQARRRWQLRAVESEGDLVPAEEYAPSLRGCRIRYVYATLDGRLAGAAKFLVTDHEVFLEFIMVDAQQQKRRVATYMLAFATRHIDTEATRRLSA